MSRKIAVLCNYELLPDRVGGMDYFFWYFDKKCKEEGIEVDWFFPNVSRHGQYERLTIYEAARTGQSVEHYFLEHLQSERIDYDYLCTHFVELCTPFFKKAKSLSTATIISIDHNPRPFEGYSWRKRLEKHVKGLLYARYIDLFVGVSAYTKTQIIKDFGSHLAKKTIVVYNGVVTDQIRYKAPGLGRPPKFLSVSHLRYSKGIQDLIAAVAQLPDTIRAEIQVDLYGDGPYKAELVAKAQGLGVLENFSFLGSRSDLKDKICEYDYMVQPTYMECFSLAILESLAANVPVITTEVGGNTEVIVDGENGFVFPAGNVLAISNLISDLWNGKAPKKLEVRPEIERRFSIQQMVDSHFKLLQPYPGELSRDQTKLQNEKQ